MRTIVSLLFVSILAATPLAAAFAIQHVQPPPVIDPTLGQISNPVSVNPVGGVGGTLLDQVGAVPTSLPSTQVIDCDPMPTDTVDALVCTFYNAIGPTVAGVEGLVASVVGQVVQLAQPVTNAVDGAEGIAFAEAQHDGQTATDTANTALGAGQTVVDTASGAAGTAEGIAVDGVNQAIDVVNGVTGGLGSTVVEAAGSIYGTANGEVFSLEVTAHDQCNRDLGQDRCNNIPYATGPAFPLTP